MRLTTGSMQREADRHAIEDLGVPSTLLMERAAAALAGMAMEKARNGKKTAAVFCGSGNNGGDGIAAARRMLLHGFRARVFLLCGRERLSADSNEMLRRLREIDQDVERFSASDEVKKYVNDCGVIIDAMLGTGLKRPMEGEYAEAAEMMNSSPAPVISADIASGVDSDTGNVPGAAVRADVTVTFAAPKIGQYAEPGCEFAGEIICADIGIEVPECADKPVYAVTVQELFLPKRACVSHKGDYGRVLIVAGSTGYTGAPVLAAEAAVRSGAGLVFLGVPEAIYPVVAASCREAMPFPLTCDAMGRLSSQALPEIGKRLAGMDAVLAGPGLSVTEEVRSVIFGLADSCGVPLILDADGINCFAGNIDRLWKTNRRTVITPHDGEFSRVGGPIGADRMGAVRSFAERTGIITVLKGHRTVTAVPDGTAYVNTTGNAGMATGGSGDVLSGVLLALLAVMEPGDAARTAVWLHGRAGDIAAEKLGMEAMRPTDIIENLHCALEELERR